MQLSDIRNEVYNNGFDAGLFPASRLNTFINQGYLSICRRVDYYVDEATNDFSTVQGTIKYAFPTGFGKIRHLWDTSRGVRILPVTLREIDNSGLPGSGPPQYYAIDGSFFHLWPTPDGIYPLECRYWLMPALLVNDTDVPTLPVDYHDLLWMHATSRCYKAEDDFTLGGQWQQDFEARLAQFMADVKFPDAETPDVARSMWDTERGLTQKGWSLWGWL